MVNICVFNLIRLEELIYKMNLAPQIQTKLIIKLLDSEVDLLEQPHLNSNIKIVLTLKTQIKIFSMIIYILI